jgi:hypothetical protein
MLLSQTPKAVSAPKTSATASFMHAPQLLPAIIISTASCHAHTFQNSLDIRLTFSIDYIWTISSHKCLIKLVWYTPEPNSGTVLLAIFTRATEDWQKGSDSQQAKRCSKWYFLTRTKSSCSASSVTWESTEGCKEGLVACREEAGKSLCHWCWRFDAGRDKERSVRV